MTKSPFDNSSSNGSHDHPLKPKKKSPYKPKVSEDPLGSKQMKTPKLGEEYWWFDPSEDTEFD